MEAKMWTDPIVDELHRIREEHAARFNFDLGAIVADLRRVEAEWPGPKIAPPPRPSHTDSTTSQDCDASQPNASH
ncbi:MULTISPECIES: hypothetical protein [unclassified Thiocapsa]|uniref:hypothetical protein n=1 Tax=unclassified Thiocapsa TaxID=2641286 RepID=UPI0035B0477D